MEKAHDKTKVEAGKVAGTNAPEVHAKAATEPGKTEAGCCQTEKPSADCDCKKTPKV